MGGWGRVGVGIGSLGTVRAKMLGVGLPMVMVETQLVLEPLLVVLARVVALAAEMMVLDPVLMALVRVLVVAAVQTMEKKPGQVLQRKVTPLMLLVQLLLQLATLLRAAHLVTLLVLLLQLATLLRAARLVTLMVLLLQLAPLLRAARLVTLLVLLQAAAVLMMLQAATVLVNLQAVALLRTAEQEQMLVPCLGGQVPVQLFVMRRAPGSTLTSCQENTQDQLELALQLEQLLGEER